MKLIKIGMVILIVLVIIGIIFSNPEDSFRSAMESKNITKMEKILEKNPELKIDGIDLLETIKTIKNELSQEFMTSVKNKDLDKMKTIIDNGLTTVNGKDLNKIYGNLKNKLKKEREKEEKLAFYNKILNAETINISPSGDLKYMMDMGSKYTDIQRDNMKERIIGKYVQWTLPVYEVSKKGENRYYIISDSSTAYISSYITIITKNQAENNYIESIMTGDRIKFKGKVDGFNFLRTIEIEPAILIK